MRKAIILSIGLIIISFFSGYSQHENRQENTKERARNIILLIADGAGVSHFHAGIIFNQDKLNIEFFKNIGLAKTHSSDSFLTDSGASGTAIATGKKTYNGAIGVDTDTLPATSILEHAARMGKSTGLVATCEITHATPAAFYAHQKDRSMREEIAFELAHSDVDVFMGGGLMSFNNRADQTDLLKTLKDRNYQIALHQDDLDKVNSGKIAGLFYDGHPPRIKNGRGDLLFISTKKALEILSQNPDGFFLMIEGSQIDWGGHDNDTEYILEEMIDFDKAVGLALNFAKKDNNTLVIVTSDHETGGMALEQADLKKGIVKAKYINDDHTGVMVPVFAFGPHSEDFRGIYDNTDIFFKMMGAFGFERIE
jgi:alkaline phosphatase